MGHHLSEFFESREEFDRAHLDTCRLVARSGDEVQVNRNVQSSTGPSRTIAPPARAADVGVSPKINQIQTGAEGKRGKVSGLPKAKICLCSNNAFFA